MTRYKEYIKYLIFIIGLVFILLGLIRQENLVVLQKAINICLECIGIG